MKKEYYHTYKNLGICTSCGKHKAVEGKTLCEECAVIDSERKRNYDKKRKSEYNKRKKELCDAFGVCTTCMQRDKYKGKQCMECYLKRRRKYKEKQAESDKVPKELWDGLGLCMICGGERYEGSKLCETHLKIARKNAINMRKSLDMSVHTWKTQKDMEIKRMIYFSNLKQSRLAVGK